MTVFTPIGCSVGTAWKFVGSGNPGSFLANLAGPAAGTLNMLPWGAFSTYTDFTLAPATFAGFDKTRSSISATNVLAPNGTATGQHLAEDSSTNTHLVFCRNCPVASLSFIPIRIAVIAKAAERTRMVVQWMDNNTDTVNTTVTIGFDLAGGNTGYDNSIGSHQTLLSGPTMTSLPNGWWLCQFDVVRNVFASSGGATLWSPGIYIDAGSGTAARNINYAGNGTNGINLWWFSAMPREAWNLTQQVFYDDFASLATIDMTNSKAPGFNWYMNQPWPNAVPQSFWNYLGYPTSNPANFTQPMPSVVLLFNPNTNQSDNHTILETSISDGANGFIGTQFQLPMFVDTYVSSTVYNTSGNWNASITIWHPSMESKTNNGLNATFQFREYNTFETGGNDFQTGELGEWLNPANHEAPNAYSGNNGITAISPTTPLVFHRVSGIWITRDQNGFGWGCNVGFLDGQMGGGQFGIGTYSATARPNPDPVFNGNSYPGSMSQLDWHHGSITMASPENVTTNPGGGWPLYVDWVKVYQNPSRVTPRPTWNPADQLLTGTGILSPTLAFADAFGLQVTKTTPDAAWDMIRAGMGKGAGQWYWEITITGTVATAASLMLGITNQFPAAITTGVFPGGQASGAGARHGSNWNSFVNGVTGVVATAVTFAANDVFGFAFDATAGKMYIHRNGTWVNGTPASGNAVWTGMTTASPGISGAGWYPAAGIHDTGCTAIANFGQSSFAFSVPSGYNAGLS